MLYSAAMPYEWCSSFCDNFATVVTATTTTTTIIVKAASTGKVKTTHTGH